MPGNDIVIYDFWEYWSGHKLHLPSGGSDPLLWGNGNGAVPSGVRYVTKSHWLVQCLTESYDAAGTFKGEGFKVLSPDGTEYFLDRYGAWKAKSITKASASTLLRQEIAFLPTKARDRFGNEVTYTYNSDDRVTRIEGSDGRVIEFAYVTYSGPSTSGGPHHVIKTATSEGEPGLEITCRTATRGRI